MANAVAAVVRIEYVMDAYLGDSVVETRFHGRIAIESAQKVGVWTYQVVRTDRIGPQMIFPRTFTLPVTSVARYEQPNSLSYVASKCASRAFASSTLDLLTWSECR